MRVNGLGHSLLAFPVSPAAVMNATDVAFTFPALAGASGSSLCLKASANRGVIKTAYGFRRLAQTWWEGAIGMIIHSEAEYAVRHSCPFWVVCPGGLTT